MRMCRCHYLLVCDRTKLRPSASFLAPPRKEMFGAQPDSNQVCRLAVTGTAVRRRSPRCGGTWSFDAQVGPRDCDIAATTRVHGAYSHGVPFGTAPGHVFGGTAKRRHAKHMCKREACHQQVRCMGGGARSCRAPNNAAVSVSSPHNHECAGWYRRRATRVRSLAVVHARVGSLGQWPWVWCWPSWTTRLTQSWVCLIRAAPAIASHQQAPQSFCPG